MQAPDERAYVDPELYDAIHTPGTAGEVDGLQRLFARFVLGDAGPAARRRTLGFAWLEPASGTGRYLRVLATRMARPGVRGGKLIGVDREPLMLHYASVRAARLAVSASRRMTLIRADMRRLTARHVRAGSIDAAFCLHNTIRHLSTAGDVVAHLRCIRRALSSRGVYAVGLELVGPPGEGTPAQFPSEAAYTAVRGGAKYRQVFEYLPPAGPDDPFETVITWAEVERSRRGRSDRREVASTYRLRCWSVSEWRQMVDDAGLREIGVVDGSGNDLPAGRKHYALRLLARKDAR